VRVSLIGALTVAVHLAVIVRLWPIRAAYVAFLTLMAYSAFFHAAAALFSDIASRGYRQFWSISLVILVGLQIAAALELLRRWIAEYPGLRMRILLAGGLVAFVVGGTLLYAWPDPFRLYRAATVLENSAGVGLAVYLVIVCGLLRLLYPAARPNLRRHAVLYTTAMVIAAVATRIGSAANWWFAPASIAVYLGYLTLTPEGEIPTRNDDDDSSDPEAAYTNLVQEGRKFYVAKNSQ
jgi:hypothetical protein